MEAKDMEAKDMDRKDMDRKVVGQKEKEVKDMGQVHLPPCRQSSMRCGARRAALVATPWRGGCGPRSRAVGRAETGKRMA